MIPNTAGANRIMGIPKIYWNEYLSKLTPMNQEQTEYTQKLMALSKGEFWSLCVLGTVGNGKTKLACALCSQYEYLHSYTVRYITQEMLVDKCRATYSEEQSEMSVIQDYENCELLVIDELTTRGWSDYTKNLIQKILSYRHAQNRRTILIGNLGVPTFKTMFDAHILSRLREGRTQIMTAPDMRLSEDF